MHILAKQMGTSVQMIKDHYGHVNPVKNAERILQGLPGWEPIIAASSCCRDRPRFASHGIAGKTVA